ncbi:hypothetical protein O181_002387 [Austropuccinia psidii MF-1]|uniref:GAG-pre-integrase domain-containing protein n=1 Tax=Austropuccinia psidii MF-1 TaxID=1389203 RepID=A0A9Q3GDX4_9BASI|nr:hypothetical protein [Austropuccinia psidii MF-1]
MIRQITTASPSFDHSTKISRINALFPGHKDRNGGQKSRSTSAPQSTARTTRPKKEAKTFDPSKPCFYCGELEILEALLNSGATHSVVGNVSLFTHIVPTNMSLSVASNQKLPVVGIGQIRLKMKKGFLTINNVLYCKEILGIIGQMIGQLIGVTFYNNQFIIHQGGINFQSFKRDDSWFLAIKRSSPTIDFRPLNANLCDINETTCNYSLEELSSLWHQRLGHLSIRNLNQILKYNAADGINNSYLQTFGICQE